MTHYKHQQFIKSIFQDEDKIFQNGSSLKILIQLDDQLNILMQINLTQQQLEQVYKWIDGIPLSRPKRNVGKDFSDAVLLAEIIAHYNPNIIQLHNFISVGSFKQKLDNWNTLQQKVLKKLKIQLNKQNIAALAGAEPQAIERLILIVKKAIEKEDIPSSPIISKTTTKMPAISNLHANSKPKSINSKQIKKRKDVKQFIQAKNNQIQQLQKIMEMQFQDQGGQFADTENLQQMLGDLTLEDDNNSGQVNRNDSTIFIIDCSADMLSSEHGQDPQLKIIFDGYANFMKSKIISNSSDRVGLILFNVKNTSNSLNFQGIHTVQDLSQPSAIRIKNAEDLIDNFATKFGLRQARIPLHQAFWLYSHQIKDLDHNKFHLRLFLFTNEDEPHQMGDSRRQLAISHAKQLLQKDVHIELFPLKKIKGNNFDIKKFYNEIINFDPEDINEGVLDGSSKIMDLQSRLRQKQFKKRTLNRLLLNIGTDTTMGLKVFSLFNKARKPTPKKVDAATNKLLQRVTKKLNRQGQTLFDTQIGTYYPLGNQKVKFSKLEMAQIKNLQQPGMILMGFKPKSYIKPYYNLRTSYFVYPDDEHVSGSSQFSDALIKELKLRNMVAIVKVVPRASQQLRFAALFPQQESFDQQDHFQTPPGFNMIFLPFAEDIANFSGEKTIVEPSTISTQLVHVTKLLINNLTISNFDFRNFENPSLQKFYSHLQGHALNQKQIQERADLLQPDQEGLAKFQDIIDLVKQTALADIERIKMQDNQDMDCKRPKKEQKQVKAKGRKKKGKMSQSSQEQIFEKKPKRQEPIKKGSKKATKMISQSSQENYWQPQDKKMQPVKRTRTKKMDAEVKQQYQSSIKQLGTIEKQKDEGIVGIIEGLMMQGQFNSAKVADLRAYLKSFGLETVGKKQELIDRVLNFMSNKNSI